MQGDPTAATVRVMVFNVEDGGAGVALDKVGEAIRLAEPDIVALQEAMGNTRLIAELAGMAYASVRTQVIARHPILDRREGDDPVLVEVLPGRVVAVGSVHLPAEPYGPDLARRGAGPDAVRALERRTRLPRLRRTLDAVRRLAASGMPAFLAGDLNAPSHLDWTGQAPDRRPRPMVDWPVSRAIEAAGFRDAWRDIHPDPVGEPGLTWLAARPPTGGYDPGPDVPHDRIDFIYASGPATTVDCRIVGEPGAPDVALAVEPWPSDHRAVVATFRTCPAPAPTDGTRFVARARTAPVGPLEPVSIATSKAAYRVGEPIEVTWSRGPAFRWDWIAVFRASAPMSPGTFLLWEHTGARSSGSVCLDGGSAEVDQSPAGGRWPLQPGAYEVAYLLDDSLRLVARAGFVVV